MEKVITIDNMLLTADVVSAGAARIAREEGCADHSFLSVPTHPDDMRENRILVIMSRQSGEPTPESERIAERVLKRLALEMYSDTPVGVFTGEDVNSLRIEQIPSPEDEINMIKLSFVIEKVYGVTFENVRKFCEKYGYRCLKEHDGAVVKFNEIIMMDLYFDEKPEAAVTIRGTLDATFAGAGVFADACDFADELAKSFSGAVEYHHDERLTYPDDRDFGKLYDFYVEMVRQQLAFAYASDRDGAQAYIAWSLDTYEPEEIPGTVITCFGRYDLDRLRSEVEIFGLDAVADHYFLFRNHRYKLDDGLDCLKLALETIWSRYHETREFEMRALMNQPRPTPAEKAAQYLQKVCKSDISNPIPPRVYYQMAQISHGVFDQSATSHPLYVPHFNIGYLYAKVGYGFGSYLRRVRLPGDFYPFEESVGEHVIFTRHIVSKDGTRIEEEPEVIDVTIDYAGDENYLEKRIAASNFDWNDYDIGGNSICKIALTRIPDEKPEQFYFEVDAEILIRDELYSLKCTTRDLATAIELRDAIIGSRAVEDVSELELVNPDEKPRAIGGCFFRTTAPSHENELVRRIEDKLYGLLTPTTVLTAERGTVTDVSSKLGGVPYIPAGKKFLPAEKGLKFLFQINFADVNPDKLLKNIPCDGLLQVWVKDPESLMRQVGGLILKNGDDVKIIFIPKPQGGYIIDEDGEVLQMSTGLTLPPPESEEFAKIAKVVADEYPDGKIGISDVINAYRCPLSHVGGSLDIYRGGRDVWTQSKLIRDDYCLIAQIVWPGQTLRAAVLCPKADTADDKFTLKNAILVSFHYTDFLHNDPLSDRFIATSERFVEEYIGAQTTSNLINNLLNENSDADSEEPDELFDYTKNGIDYLEDFVDDSDPEETAENDMQNDESGRKTEEKGEQ